MHRQISARPLIQINSRDHHRLAEFVIGQALPTRSTGLAFSTAVSGRAAPAVGVMFSKVWKHFPDAAQQARAHHPTSASP
jgi:hypothetical protein